MARSDLGFFGVAVCGAGNSIPRSYHVKRAYATRPLPQRLRKERVPVSIYLVNGIKLQGQVESFDQFVVLLKNTVSQMVYKHAISTVVPARNVRIPLDGPEEDDADNG